MFCYNYIQLACLIIYLSKNACLHVTNYGRQFYTHSIHCVINYMITVIYKAKNLCETGSFTLRHVVSYSDFL